MRILAIDSSGLVASAAIVEDDNLIAEYTLNYKKTHSETLLPMIDEIIKAAGDDMASIDAIAIAKGPGSFTGLRIGSATAKGLGLALDKPIVEIPTVDGLAYNLYCTEYIICPIMDARRKQVYTGVYGFDGDRFIVHNEQMVVSVDEIITILDGYGKSVVFLGDGVPVYKDIIDANIKSNHIYAPAHLNKQRAGAIGSLAIEYMKAGKFVNADDHNVDYLRLSQAERERMEKQAASDKE